MPLPRSFTDLVNNLTILPGVGEKTAERFVYSLYEKGQIFALHSQEESQGIVFAEAMAVGLPVVATNVGGVPYVVKNNECGLLSDYSDVEDFAKNLISMLSDKDLYSRISQYNKTEAINYKWSTISDKIIDLYKKL